MNILKALGLVAALSITIASAGEAQAQKTPKFTNVTSSIAITDANSVPYTIS